METFNFGTIFKRWTRVIYTSNNITSCMINNGFSSPFFNLHHDVRQGCPLSGMFFILVIEILSFVIRSDKLIKGIQVHRKEIKLSQYANDTTTFVKDGISLRKLLGLLEHFKECSSFKINSISLKPFGLEMIKTAMSNCII